MLLLSVLLALAPQTPLAPPGLTPWDYGPSLGARFGRALAVEGDLAVVAAPFTGEGTSLGGAAYVYEWNGADWDYVVRLDPPLKSEFVEFGSSVGVSGERIVVGCLGLTSAVGMNAGGALVFERIAGVWTQVAEMLPPAGYAGLQYGLSMDFEGDLVVLAGRNTEAPYLVYERQADGSWPLMQELFLTNPGGSRPLVNSSPVIEGETLFLPDPYSTSLGGYSGEIQVWDRGASSWSLTATIRTALPAGQVLLGNAFDVSGDTLVAATSNVLIEGGVFGLAYVFERSGTDWALTDLFSDAEGPSYLQFGAEVALSGERLAIGQIGSTNFFGPEGTPAKVWVYEREGDEYQLQSVIDDPIGVPPYDPFGTNYGSLFGRRIALDGERMIVGAELDEVLFDKAGQAYGYDVGRLCVDVPELSLSSGGTQTLTLQAGLPLAGQLYFMLGSLNGTTPGLVLDGVLLPLKVDNYLLAIVSNPEGSIVQGTIGTLDADGRGTAQIVVPAGSNPTFYDLTLNHAYLVIDPAIPQVVAASEAETLYLVM